MTPETGDDSRWQVVVDSTFQRDLNRLPPRIAAAVGEFVTAVLPTNPLRMSKPLGGDLTGLRSARRGDYRILLEAAEGERTIYLLRVGHRAHIYRPR
ncbi:MAG: type II toxin-antitoxin system RelE/ParE family toxin [Nocardioidaceae bacterium]